ncbi:MAG: psrP3 [Bacteroidetes bacterium]|nr:psrP3 [Bacteroidota bacterium]
MYFKLIAIVLSLFIINQSRAQVSIFSENWASSTFTANNWTFPLGQSNWTIGASYTPVGGTSPNAYFYFSPSITNYTSSMVSNTINATTYTTGPITLDYLLQLNNFSTSTLEQFIVEYKTVAGVTWSTVAVYSNTLSGTSNWAVSNYTLAGMQGQMFQLRFTAFGANSYNINGWGLDNINVKVPCIPSLAAALTPSAVCGTGNRTLTASGSTDYTWTPGGSTNTTIVVSPTITTTYSVASTNTVAGCTETRTLLVGVTPTIVVTGPATVCATNPATLTASGATSYTWNTGATTAIIVPSPSATTVYTATGNSGGCMSSTQFTLTTSPSPTVSVSGPTLVCSSSTNVLTASGAVSYTWNTGSSASSITVSPTTNTTYTVTGSGLGCTDTKMITVNVTPTPTLSMSGPATICLGNSATLTASGANSYTWNTGANTNTIVITPSNNTTYSLAGTSSAGCMGSPKFFTVSVINPTLTGNNPYLCASSGSANLTANAFAGSTINWYPSLSSTVSLATGSVYSTPNVTVSTTYYAQATSSFTNSIFTTTAAGNGSAGNMFDVVPSTNIIWNGAAMSISSVGTVSVEIWYRSGSFVGFENANTGWTQLLTTTVTSPGTGTLVNITGFAVPLNAGQTYGLYVTTNGGGVNYTNGTLLGNTFVSNSDISVKEGKGGSYFLVTNSPRVFNGALLYQGQGCSSPLTPVTLSLNASPTISITGSSTLCAGQAANLTATGATSYTWNTGATTASIAPTPTANATYTAIGANGTCTSSATISINVSPCTGLNTNTSAVLNLKVYPNPTVAELTIELNNGLFKTIQLTDLTGRLVYVNKTDASLVNVDTKALADGVYYLKVTCNNNTEVMKIVKQ